MSKFLFFPLVVIIAIFSFSCVFFYAGKPVAELSLDCTDMPFHLNIPEDWLCKKTDYYFVIQFDDGLTGEITVSKIITNETIAALRADNYIDYDGKVEGLSLLCKDIEKNTYCKVLLTKTGAVHSMILSNKNMPEARLKEAEKIIKSVNME